MIRFLVGDLTTQEVDAVVLPANPALAPGGGASGAIHRAAGPSVAEECARLGGCETGDAKATAGGRLPARVIVHVVGPVWHGGDAGEAALLASAHRRAVEVAAEHGCRSIAFPAVSCGIYGYPPELAAPVAVAAVRDALAGEAVVEEVLFVFLDDGLRRVFAQAADRLGAA